MPPGAPEPSPAPERAPIPPQERVAVVDSARGLALALMVLDHSAIFARVNVNAETYAGWSIPFWGPGWFATGLLTNVSAPLFWCLAGTSIALLAHRERRRGDTDRFLAVRAGLLVALDQLVVMPEWSPLHPHWAVQFELLTCLGTALLMMIPLRRLADRALALLAGTMLLGYAALVRFVPRVSLQQLPAPVRLFVTYDRVHAPQVTFPVLGWLPLMMLGLLIGRRLADGRWMSPAPFVRMALAGTALGLLLREASLIGRSGGGGITAFLAMSKGPPGLDYLAVNLSLGLFAIAGFLALRSSTVRRPGRWLVAFGQVPLFLFVAHLPIAFVWAHGLRHLLPHHDAWRYALTFAGTSATLLPMARWYRGVKLRHRGSVLRYC